MNKQPVSYLQTDPRWANVSYSAKGESTTIGRSGCGPTAMSMVLATWCDPQVTPKTECAWALAHGYKAPHQGTYYGYFVPAAKRYGLICTQVNSVSIYGNANAQAHSLAKGAVDTGDLVIACMGRGNWTSSGHYVLVYGIAGNVIYINDPASTKVSRTQGNYAVFKQQVKYYWIIRRPAGKKEEPDMTEAETRKIVDEAIKKAAPEIVRQVLEQVPKPKVYDTVESLPYGQDVIQKLVDRGVLKGTGKGLGLTTDMLRMLMIQDREEAARGYGMD